MIQASNLLLIGSLPNSSRLSTQFTEKLWFPSSSPEHKLMKSEEDLTPQPRQRSNTLPKSFGSQLEKKPQQEKASKPPVESTLEGIQKKLQEKRDEVNRPEDIKVNPRLCRTLTQTTLKAKRLYMFKADCTLWIYYHTETNKFCCEQHGRNSCHF